MQLYISFLLLFLALRVNAAVPPVPAFSHMQAGGTISGWQPLRPAPDAADTRYSLVTDGAGVVLKADACIPCPG
jgi:hypothetical protein